MITINNSKLEFFIEKMMERCKVEDVCLEWGKWEEPGSLEFTIDFLFTETKNDEKVEHTISVAFERDDGAAVITISSRFMTYQKTISFEPSAKFFNKCMKFAMQNQDNTLSKREEWNTFLWQYKLLTGEEYYDEEG